MSRHEPAEEVLGLDFAQRHRIGCYSWDLGTFQRGGHVRREWALRMHRRDENGEQRSMTWLHDLPGHAELDWDEAIFLLARDAGDGRLSFDAYIEDNLSHVTTRTSLGTSTTTGCAQSTCGTRSVTSSAAAGC
jgi:hypothetical protein